MTSAETAAESNASCAQLLAELWHHAGGESTALSTVQLSGEEPVLPSSFRIGAAAQVTIAAAGLAAAEIWRRRTRQSQSVAVDMRHAAIEFRSERYQRIDGRTPAPAWDRIAGLYRCGDDRYVRLHTNFPYHREGMLRLLGCGYDRTEVAGALRGWQAEALESAAAEAGLVAAMARSPGQWAAHAQGRAVASLPLLEVTRIGEAPPRALPKSPSRPLSGVRVLDLTRVVAGAVCGRTLAAHGAEVMRITAPHLPALAELDVDTGRGKLSAALDLRAAEECERLTALLRDAHVFVQGYRPGALARLGFSPEACAEARPGIIAVSLSAYGRSGPWASRRGFDSLVQAASGINHAEAEAAGSALPKELPAQALDHASGYLMALGAMLALMRKEVEGGSWHVQVSLARTGHWLANLGRLPHGLEAPDPAPADVTDLLETIDTAFGPLTCVTHAARLSATPAHWQRPPVPLGSHAPVWPL